MLSLHEIQCSFAEMVFEKYQQELYSLSACEVDYNIDEIEEQKLQMTLLQSNVRCSEKKHKIRAALSIPNPSIPLVASTGGAVVFQFIQINPAGVWVIAHNLGYNPQVNVFDTHGNPVAASIRYLDSNTLQLTFNTIIGGRANLYSQ